MPWRILTIYLIRKFNKAIAESNKRKTKKLERRIYKLEEELNHLDRHKLN